MPPIVGKDLRVATLMNGTGGTQKAIDLARSVDAEVGAIEETTFESKLQEFRKLDQSNGMADQSFKNLHSEKKDDPKAADKAARQFEALLLQQMFKEMWNSVPKNGMLSGSHEEEFYRDMLNEELANTVSAGQGIGIRAVITKDINNIEKRGKKQ